MIDEKQLPIWVCWNEKRNNKAPINPHTGGGAMSNNPSTWGTYEQAMSAAQKYGDGVGFMFADGLCGIDLDKIDSDPQRKAIADDIINTMNTYTELSPSGNGYHLIFRCDISKLKDFEKSYHNKNTALGIEFYFKERYFTYTAEKINDWEVEERTPQLLEFLNKYMKKKLPQTGGNPSGESGNNVGQDVISDNDILSIARKARNSKKFIALFDNGDISQYNGDESSADLALANILSFYSQGNALMIENLFNQSALGQRDKWKKRADYRARTIDEAIRKCNGSFYKPSKPKVKKSTLSQINVNTYAGADYFNPFDTEENRQRYRWDDAGLGYLFADTFKNISRYVPEAKSWYVYDGRVWRLDLGNMRVAQQARDLMDYLLDCRKYITDEERQDAWIKFIATRRQKRHRDTMLADAQSVYPVSILEFDKDPFLFNCQNATLNLKDFTQHKHRATDFISKISNVIFDPKANCNRWEVFIREIMRDDMETAAFLQKALGYSLTGDTSHECFFLLYGATTRNGKGVTCETTVHMMGDYARTSQPETVAQKQNTNSGNPSEDIARLRGARFVNMSEPDKGLRLNAALVKQLTGGDTVTARFLHQNSFEYRPEYKLFINTNHRPLVTDDSIFASGRIKQIPFERHFEPHEQDKGLKSFFKQPENLSGILNWFIVGLKALQAEGLSEPKAVKDATNEYREESDTVGLFVRECLVELKGQRTPTKVIHADYIKWCDGYGYSPLNNRNLISDLRRKNLQVFRGTGNQLFLADYGLSSTDDIPLDFQENT